MTVPPDRRQGRDRRAAPPLHLTVRETEILAFVLRGWANKDIASELGLAQQSVKGYVSTLLQKFAVPNRAALAEAGGRLALTGGIALDPQWIPQLFLEAEPQICVARGPELRYEAVNDAFARSVGNRPLLGRTMREAFPELEGQGIFEMVERVYATGQSVIQHEATSKWDRGQGVETRVVDLVVQPLRDEAGTVNGVVSFAVDVSDVVRQRRQAALMSEGFGAILDLVPSGVIVVDDQATIVMMNAAARRIAGTPDETRLIDVHAEGMLETLDAGDRVLGKGDTPIGRALRGEAIVDADYNFMTGTSKGSVRVRASIRPLRGDDGDVRGAIVEFAETP